MSSKRIVGIFLAIVLMTGLVAFPVQADGVPAGDGLTMHTAETEVASRSVIGPQWLNTDYIVHGITIGSGGASTVSVSFYTYSKTDRISGTATLQRLTDSGSWSDVESWNFSGTGSAYLSESYTVGRGSYRVKTVGSVYTSSGSFVEKVTVYSQRKTY